MPGEPDKALALRTCKPRVRFAYPGYTRSPDKAARPHPGKCLANQARSWHYERAGPGCASLTRATPVARIRPQGRIRGNAWRTRQGLGTTNVQAPGALRLPGLPRSPDKAARPHPGNGAADRAKALGLWDVQAPGALRLPGLPRSPDKAARPHPGNGRQTGPRPWDCGMCRPRVRFAYPGYTSTSSRRHPPPRRARGSPRCGGSAPAAAAGPAGTGWCCRMSGRPPARPRNAPPPPVPGAG
jgi:hypothetical protein